MIGSVEAQPITGIGPMTRLGHWLRVQAEAPVRLFVWLSLFFGLALVALTPPLRGADEPAHFLRAYGIARGEIVPVERVDGRLGIRLPADLHAAYSFFEDARYRFADTATPYGETFAEFRRRDEPAIVAQTAFVPYQGSEAYTPVAYLPYAAVALIGRPAGAEFLPLLYAMRVAGLIVWTGIVAAAIAISPGLRWPFLLIALLPGALQGRATVSADGAAIALAMLATALALRAGARASPHHRIGQRVGWMTLCVLVKPSQLALAPIELLTACRRGGRLWLPAATILPGVLLTGLWVYLTGGEVAAWRLIDEGYAAEQFGIGWKLAFMADHPGHVAGLLVESLRQQVPVLYAQLIGVLGWLDTPLRSWAYPVLGLTLAVAMADRIDWPQGAKGWGVVIAGCTAAGYVAFVYFLFYVTWTPIDADQIWGVQGRYFLPALPAVTAAVAMALPGDRTARPARIAALAGAVLSGAAAIDAVWRTNW